MNKFARLSPLIIIIIFSLVQCKRTSQDINIILEKEPEIITKEIKSSAGYGVVNVDRLRFRADNDLHSKTLRYLDKGTIVSILKKDNKRVKIGEMEGYWYQIEYSGITGWVFGYFLDIFSRYQNAEFAANLYKDTGATKEEISSGSILNEHSINNNLFFLSNGKLLKVTDVVNGKAKILNTQSGLMVTNYFFINNPNTIYYIAKRENNYNSNGFLYTYDLDTGKNDYVLKDVYEADINLKNSLILVLSQRKAKNDVFWTIKTINLEKKNNIKEITMIKKKKESEDLENDMFSKTLQREKGSLVTLKLDDNGNFIYFKPPEENQTYLISMSTGESIQIDAEEYKSYDIDDTRYAVIYSEGDESGIGLYSIVLKDKLSGMEKELVKSELYPLNISVSPRKNFLAISMIDLNKISSNYHKSSIYVLSLSTYSLKAISTEGRSYQPKWSNYQN